MGVPQQVVDAANDRVSGATPIARTAVDGLLTVAGDPAALARAVQVLRDGQPAMAPVWHVERAATTVQPARSLTLLRARLDEEIDRAVAAAVAWLASRGGPVRTASSSSLVDAVLPLLEPTDGPAVGLMGADAIGPDAVLNGTGSLALAGEVPTLVVATTVKLVPASVFDRLAAPGFERIALDQIAAVVVGGDVLTPAEAGRRAAELG